MSQNKAVDFLENVYKNDDLNQRLTSSESWEDVVKIAGDAGYTFSSEEYTDALGIIADKYDAESPLAEQHLDLVSGGTEAAAGCCCCCCACCCEFGEEE